MKQFSLLLTVMFLCSASAIAQSAGGGRGGPGFGGPGGPPHGGPSEQPSGASSNAVLAAIDADGNHTISAREIANASAALRKLDQNRDGQLTSDEVHGNNGVRVGQQGQRGQQRGVQGRGGQQSGRNGLGGAGPGGAGGAGGAGPGGAGSGNGGPPTADQFMSHAMTFDVNKDGQLSRAELQKMAAAVAEEMGRRGGGPGAGSEQGRGGRPGAEGRSSGSRQRPSLDR